MGKRVRKGIMIGTVTAMVAGAVIAPNFTREVQAYLPGEKIELSNWTFFQGGPASLANPNEYENGNGNCGFINSVALNDTNEEITGWARGFSESSRESKTATKKSSGFQMDIANTGWDRMWKNDQELTEDRINPWSVQAQMTDVAMIPGHTYTVSFTGSASSNKSTIKFAYVDFSTEVDGTKLAPYDGDVLSGDSQIIVLRNQESKYIYTFTNWVSGQKLSVNIMLGAFGAQYDQNGVNVSDIIYQTENNWSGTVSIKDFQIIDEGIVGPMPPIIVQETTTEKAVTDTPTPKSDKQLASEFKKNCKVAKVQKAEKKKSAKKIKVTLKKALGNADGYEVRFYRKKVDAKKNRKVLVKAFTKKNKKVFTVSHKKLKNKKNLFVRVRGFKVIGKKTVYGQKWSAVKTVRIK
ncbi:MAG: hypothetical protein K6G85_05775 [Eubacterium sp.]|nr:hypothetical protein [Eubacterium sp.]